MRAGAGARAAAPAPGIGKMPVARLSASGSLWSRTTKSTQTRSCGASASRVAVTVRASTRKALTGQPWIGGGDQERLMS